MLERGLESFFEDFLHKESLFLDRNALLSSYIPETINHRDGEIKKIANILAPALKQEKPSNVFVYGNTGTGKTLVVKHVTENMVSVAGKKNIPFKHIYVNCKLKRVADTEYRLVAQLAQFFGKTTPPTGLPTDEIYNIFYKAVESHKGVILLTLDEIDQLIKRAGDGILYNLTRINEELKESRIAIIGVSNDTTFIENIDARVKSSLSEEDVFFAPYNAMELQSILRNRAARAFSDGVVGEGVIEKCAAYVAREYGDARKAIELLRVAGEIAERSKNKKISTQHIDDAEEKLEKDKIFDIIKMQPKQFQAVLFSIFSLKSKSTAIYGGEIYDLYKELCFKTGLRPLTQRRVSSIIGEFELMGMISTRTISKGRYGRTREIRSSISASTIPLAKKILEEELELR